MTLGEREVLLLCSNNYLGLADHPRVREAAAEAAIALGRRRRRLAADLAATWSPTASSRTQLAGFKGYEAALLFGSGYLANTGTIAALAGEGEVVFSDELNHASIVDGCRLSKARDLRLPPRRPRSPRLGSAARPASAAALIVTDGVFSMDGDVAPLTGLQELAHRHGARLMVDEAHATGAVGPGGRGSVAAAGLSGEVDVVVGTLGKALGSYGAYVCADAETVDYLVNRARPFVFSTALPPTSVAAAGAALELLEAEPERVERLQANAAALRAGLAAEGLAAGDHPTQIVPIVVGEAEPTMELCERLLERGVFAQGIRPPTVPEGSSRLRFTVMSTHDAEQLREAARATGAAARELGLASAAPAATPVA